ncbi:MAG TPA: adenylate/guanylate cyclase domain-containing protein [Polyangia bacterium]|nr:adenylate/guanylate cyclase domain-containing protein [Polyangia bacterium]
MADDRDRTALKAEHPLVAGLVVALVFSALVALHRTGHELPGFESFERRTLDLRFQLRGPIPPGSEVAIVAFDDRTLEAEPALFEQRRGFARVVRAVHQAGAKAIGIDALFADPEQILPADLARDIDGYLAARPAPGAGPSDTAADGLLRRVQAEGQGDARLVEALREARNVVLGIHMGLREGRSSSDPSLSRGKYGQSVPGPYVPRTARDIAGSAPIFTAAARGLGIMTVHEDETQTLRALPLVREYQGGYFAPLSVQLLALHHGLSRATLAYLGTEHSVRIGQETVPLGDDDAILLNFRGPAGTFPTYSAIDALRGTLPPDALRGRIVLLALTHLGHDTTRTSFGPGFPGVEMHATAIDNLLRRDWLTRASWRSDTLACLALGILISFIFWPRLGLSPLLQSLGTLLLAAAYLGLSHRLFVSRGLWLCWMGPIITSVAVSTACLTFAYAREGRQRRRLRHAFAHYLADGVIQELLADPRALSLGGARRHLTVLFSDIRGFTSISERLDPEQLIKVLNTYLTPMTRAVLANGGFLDKFIGDAVMAVFGAPVPNDAHPTQALACVLRMRQELLALQPVLKAEMGIDLQIGVGVNSGDMVVGNMGSDEHFNYTVVGDAVNLSSRLEGLTKAYGVFCLVGDETRRRAAHEYSFREVDLVQVKGKAEPVAIHELLAGPGCVVANYEERQVFAEAMTAYRKGHFAEARRLFGRFAERNPGDHVAPLYLDRLAGLGDEPPPGWNGVFVHKSK